MDGAINDSVEEWNEFDLGWVHPHWPKYIILFEGLFDSVPSQYTLPSSPLAETIGDDLREESKGDEIAFGQVLIKKGYRIKKRIWNSFFHEKLRSGDVILLERT